MGRLSGTTVATAVPEPLVARPARDTAEKARVTQLAAARHASAGSVRFARIVQLSWRGAEVTAIAAVLGCHPHTVRRCLQQFNAQGLRGLGLSRRRARSIDTVMVADRYL